MLRWGLKKLQENCESLNYKEVNLQRYMTLSVENLHSGVNRKKGTQTLISFLQDIEKTMQEFIKAATKWSVHQLTSKERWYPLPNSTVSMALLQFPKRTKNLSGKTLN